MRSKQNENLWAALLIGPALLVLLLILIYPTIRTVIISFLDQELESFVGFKNYIYSFTNRSMLISFRNNLMWLIIFTAVTVGLGLVLAVLSDRIKYEKIAKSIIFMPMAVSFVGAGVIWKFVYTYRPPGAEQIGLLNKIMVMFGGQPKGWLLESPWTNNLSLIFVGIWIWTGFCMVMLSAAYKGIPQDLLDAARVDGANEWQIFWHVILPWMKSSIAVVATTMVVNVLKIFDIVYVMTNGNYDTEVIANRMFKEMFQYRNFGRASAIAVILFLCVIPVIVININRMRGEEE